MGEPADAALRERLTVAFAVLAGVAFVVSLNLTPVFNSDFWIQLAVGDVIRTTGEIPDTYGFTYTDARDAPYFATNWLACWTWSQLFGIAGYEGMIVVKSLLVLGIFGLIAALSRQVERDPNLAVALSCLAVLGINFRSLLRPELVGFALALVELNCLQAFVRSGRLRWLLALVPTSVVWANVHASFLVSLGFPVCFATGELLDHTVQRLRGRDTDPAVALRRVGWLAAAEVGMALAMLVNPYGIHLFGHLLLGPDTAFMRENIWEWQSVFHQRFRREPFFFVFVATSALVIVSGIARPRRVRGTPLLLIGLFLPLALFAMRHVPWLEIAASLWLAHTLGGTALARRWRTPIGAALGLALLAGTAWVVENGNTRGRRPGFRNEAPLKPAVIDFIREAGISGNVLHAYSYGDQLAYHFHPQIRVAMDTRIYDEKHYHEFRSVAGGNPALLVDPAAFRDYLERYDVGAIVTRPLNMQVWGAKGCIPIIQELDFEVVYLDDETIVLRRR